MLDLEKAFHQVPVAPESAPFLTVATPLGLREPTRMTLGTCTAPPHMQRVMDAECAAYLPSLKRTEESGWYFDDGYLISRRCDGMTEAELLDNHQASLIAMLRRLADTGFHGKISKCQLFRSRVNAYGFEISSSGTAPPVAKVVDIDRLPVPTSLSSVRSFLGIFNEFRPYIPEFASIAEPLFELTRKSSDRDFGAPAVEAACTKLKAALKSAPILSPFRFDQPFFADVDASLTGAGAVLRQRNGPDGALLPVRYWSHAFSPAQRNYSAGDRELLGIVEFVTDLRRYLLGRHVTIATDHAANVGINERNFTDLSPQRQRWVRKLLEFDIEIVSKRGSDIPLADALSRLPPPTEPVAAISLASSVAVPHDWQELQRNDPWCRDLFNLVSAGKTSSLGVFKIDDDGTLIRLAATPSAASIGRAVAQVVVPEELRLDLVRKAHSDYPYAHFATAATLWTLKGSYWWPGMQAMVERFIKGCPHCQVADKLPIRPAPVISLGLQTKRPFQTLHLDLAGPLPESVEGFRYFLVMVDSFTGWVELSPLKDKLARSVAEELVKNWVNRYGVPESILTDGGGEFTAESMNALYETLGVQKKTTSPYHPPTNGIAERFVRSVKSIIRKNVVSSGRQHEWPKFLATAAFALRSVGRISSNRPSPAEALFGFRLVTPVDAVAPSLSRADSDLAQSRYEVWRAIVVEAEAYYAKAAAYADRSRRAKGSEVAAGDLVLLRSPKKIPGALASFWDGPFRVKRVLGPKTVVLEDLMGRQAKSTTSVDRLKMYWNQPGSEAESPLVVEPRSPASAEPAAASDASDSEDSDANEAPPALPAVAAPPANRLARPARVRSAPQHFSPSGEEWVDRSIMTILTDARDSAASLFDEEEDGCCV